MAIVGQIGHYWMIKHPFASYLSVFSKTNHFRIEKSTTMHLFYISHDLEDIPVKIPSNRENYG